MTETALFFTPSYRPDLERLVWMRRSIERFFDGHGRHVVAVPNADLRAFRSTLPFSDVELVTQESLVEPYYYPTAWYRAVRTIAPNQAWRFAAHAGKPGWFVQQIAKIASRLYAGQDPIVFIDSDVFFYRHFDLDSLGLSDSGRCLVRIVPEQEGAKHRHHVENARRLLGLPPGPTDVVYMACPAIWYGDWVDQLLAFLERRVGKPWQRVLFEAGFPISEYTIYGVFLDEILRPAGLVVRDKPFNLIAWDAASLETLKWQALRGQLPTDRLAVTVQSNMGIDVAAYEEIFRRLLAHEGGRL